MEYETNLKEVYDEIEKENNYLEDKEMTSLEKEQLLEVVTVKIGILEDSKLYKGSSAEDLNGDVKEIVDGFRKAEQEGKLSTLELKAYAEDCSFWMNYI